jgi:hypothetical protein
VSSQTLTCTKCQKQFLVIDQEQQFLSQKGLPLPSNCPTCRQRRRLILRGSERALYKTKCQKCGKDIIVSYDPSKVNNAILCKQDYDAWLNEHDTTISEPLPTQ